MSDKARPGGVCVLHTGGTIGSRHIDPELHPEDSTMLRLDEVESVLRQRSELPVRYDFHPLLGSEAGGFQPVVSSQITTQHWALIAETIEHHYDDYDGFVVLHGTDTLAWTASALSFMFDNLSKPIVLTGSQRPISATPSDAVQNFTNAVMLAGRGDSSIPLLTEVVVCFGGLVLRGNRCSKVSAASTEGFDTANAPHLGRVGRKFEIDMQQLRKPPADSDACFVRTNLEQNVADIVLYPGMPARLLEGLLEGCRGAVVRTFGAGNAPGGEDLERVLAEAVERGTLIVNVTQCGEGTVESGMFTGSTALARHGVLSGLDLTSEAALTKLMFLLGNESAAVAAEQMQLDQRGEQSFDLVELHAESGQANEEGVHVLELTPALHARFRPDKVTSAVLRLQITGTSVGSTASTVTVFLNNPRPPAVSRKSDPRALGEKSIVVDAQTGKGRVVFDATKAARQVLRSGYPATVAVRPDAGFVKVSGTLSLFVEREVTDG